MKVGDKVWVSAEDVGRWPAKIVDYVDVTQLYQCEVRIPRSAGGGTFSGWFSADEITPRPKNGRTP